MSKLDDFKVGVRVKHGVFGEGLVNECSVSGWIRILFDECSPFLNDGQIGMPGRCFYFYAPDSGGYPLIDELTILEDKLVFKPKFKKGDILIANDEPNQRREIEYIALSDSYLDESNIEVVQVRFDVPFTVLQGIGPVDKFEVKSVFYPTFVKVDNSYCSLSGEVVESENMEKTQAITKDNIKQVLEYNDINSTRLTRCDEYLEFVCTDGGYYLQIPFESPKWLEHIELEVGKLKPLPVEEDIMAWFQGLQSNEFNVLDEYKEQLTFAYKNFRGKWEGVAYIWKAWPFERQKDAILKLMEIYK